MSVEKKEKHRKVVNIGKRSRHKCHKCFYSGLCPATGEQKQAGMLPFKCHHGKQREKAQK